MNHPAQRMELLNKEPYEERYGRNRGRFYWMNDDFARTIGSLFGGGSPDMRRAYLNKTLFGLLTGERSSDDWLTEARWYDTKEEALTDLHNAYSKSGDLSKYEDSQREGD